MLDDAVDPAGDQTPADAVVVPVDRPIHGTPVFVNTPDLLKQAAEALGAGVGPVAVDAERASGYRYSARAYLVQLYRRDGGPTYLIDPLNFRDFSPVATVLAEAEWVFHAASQDLPSLAEIGLRPPAIFDTELAARLLGWPRVGLAAVVARCLGLGLAKEHSAADWSVRPLPQDWLTYAALDVDLLIDVRDVLEAELVAAGKTEIAAQEFEAVRLAPAPAPRAEPWRRTSGLHQLRDQHKLAIVRALWEARDRLGRQLDIAPGRLLRDYCLIEAAEAMPTSQAALVALKSFGTPGQRRRADYWFAAIEAAHRLTPEDWPTARGPRNLGPPPPRVWRERNPAAAARFNQVRTALAALSDQLAIPVEHFCQPDLLRRTLWDPPTDIPTGLAAGGARPWQIETVAPVIMAAVRDHPDGGSK